jgi:hypothetical protein
MNLQLEILMVLRDAGEHLLPQTTLVSNLRLRDRKESIAQIEGDLKALEARQQIVGAHNPDTGAKWKIADNGTVRLAEANL